MMLVGACTFELARSNGIARTFCRKWHPVSRIAGIGAVFAAIKVLAMASDRSNVFFIGRWVGRKSVAYYSATGNVVSSVPALISVHFLARVLYPTLSRLWVDDRPRAIALARSNGLWIAAVAFPVMFVLHQGSRLILGTVYPSEYSDAIWMQKYLVWSMIAVFIRDLCTQLMFLQGAVGTLLVFQALVLAANLVMNALLVPRLGLAGACIVFVATKLLLAILTFCHSQAHLGLFRAGDALRAFLWPVICLGLHVFLLRLVPPAAAAAAVVAIYSTVTLAVGRRAFASPEPTPAAHSGGVGEPE